MAERRVASWESIQASRAPTGGRQALRELGACAGQARAHGADVDAAHLRGLGVRELRELAQDEHVAVVRRDGGERTAHLLGRFVAQDALERRVVLDTLLDGRRVVVEACRIRGDLAQAHLLAREVARDAAEPRADAAAGRIVLRCAG